MPWCNTSSLGIEHQLTETDGNPSRALVPDTKHSLVIGNHRHPDITVDESAQNVFRSVNVTRIEVQTVCLPEHG